MSWYNFNAYQSLILLLGFALLNLILFKKIIWKAETMEPKSHGWQGAKFLKHHLLPPKTQGQESGSQAKQLRLTPGTSMWDAGVGSGSLTWHACYWLLSLKKK